MMNYCGSYVIILQDKNVKQYLTFDMGTFLF